MSHCYFNLSHGSEYILHHWTCQRKVANHLSCITKCHTCNWVWTLTSPLSHVLYPFCALYVSSNFAFVAIDRVDLWIRKHVIRNEGRKADRVWYLPQWAQLVLPGCHGAHRVTCRGAEARRLRTAQRVIYETTCEHKGVENSSSNLSIKCVNNTWSKTVTLQCLGDNV